MRRSLVSLVSRSPFLIILFCSAILLLTGLDFGLPYYSNFYIKPDETLLTIPALELFKYLGDPKFYHYPAALILIHSFVIQILHACTVLFSGTGSNMFADFIANTTFYWVSLRLISSLFAIASTFFVYKTALIVSDKRSAFIASLLYCTSPLLVREAHFAVTDTALTFSVSLFIYHLISLNKSKLSTKSSIFLGTIIGFAIGFKYSGVILLPVCFLSVAAFFQITFLEKLRSLLIILFSTCLTFLLLNPYLFYNLQELVAFSERMSSAIYVRNKGFNWTLIKTFTLLPGSLAGPCLLMFSLFKKNTRIEHRTVPALVFFAFLTPLLFSQHIPLRYYLPLTPALGVLIAIALKYILSNELNAFYSYCSKLSVFVIFTFSVAISLNLVLSLNLKDTRSLVWNYIHDNYPPGQGIAIFGQPETEPQISETETSIRRRIEYVYNLYGKDSGDIVSRLYWIQIGNSANSKVPKYEVWRNPHPLEAENVKMVIVPTFNHPTANLDQGRVDNFLSGKVVLKKIVIKALNDLQNEFLRIQDSVDAFYLDFKLATTICNPGPSYTIYLIE